MAIKTFSPKNKFSGSRAQAMVEFAIALPVLLVLLVGIMEVGRMLLMYALVNNASRDAARYASAVGLDDSGLYAKYTYCDGIKATAKSSAYFLGNSITVTVAYDTGPSGATLSGDCTNGSVASTTATTGDRVTVTVAATYKPLVKLIPISQRTFTSTTSRTILGILNLTN